MNPRIPKVSIFGVPFSKMNMDETVGFLTEAVENRTATHVITANPIMVMTALEKSSYMQMMNRAELIVPDGIGIVWAASHVGNPVPERVPGFDLMHKLIKLAAEREWTIYFLGASPETIRTTVDKLKHQYPELMIAGYRDGFFGADDDGLVIEQILAADPDLLFVGRAADNQDIWITKYRDRLNVPLMMGVGGSFDIIAGKLKRAPVLFQKLRLEWFYRLLQQPSRYRRMLALPQFAVKVIREKDKVQNS